MKINLKLLITLCLLLFIQVSSAKKFEADDVLFGLPESSGDLILRHRDGGFLKKVFNGDWLFSVDGIIEKKIGAGTGGAGGLNFFADKSFDGEDGINGWNIIGTAVIATTDTDPLTGSNSLTCDLAAQNDSCRTDEIVIPEFFKGKNCEVSFKLTGGTDDLVKPQVLDSSNVKIPGITFQNQDDETDFLKAHTGSVARSIPMICPGAGNIKFELLQTEVGNPALIKFDDVHIGELIGLKQSVLPDVVSARLDADPSTPAVFSTSVDWLDSGTPISRSSTGVYVITFKSGFFSVIPSCRSTVEPLFAGTRIASIQDISTSAITLRITDQSATAADTDFTLECQKQGVDAQQTVQVLTLPPVIAESENEFSANIDSGDAVTNESADFLNGDCTNAVLGMSTCTFVTDLFSVPPNCNCTPVGTTASGRACTIATAATTSEIVIRNTDMSNNATNQDWVIQCSRGSDHKVHKTFTVLVNQVHSSFGSGIRIEACQIDLVGGTPSADSDSGLCAGWIDSFDDTAVGRVNINVTPGVFSAAPVCTCTTESSGVFNCGIDGGPTTITDIPITIENNGGADVDQDFHIICIGAR